MSNNSKNDKKYWDLYYRKNPKPTQPSTFAQFIYPCLKGNKLLIELGCGNGRDSIYFANKLNVIGIDQIEREINYLNKKYSDENIEFLAGDFTNLKKSDNSIFNQKIDYIYSRFTFHSINEAKENRTLDWIETTLDENGMFFLEVRSIKDPMFKKGKFLSDNENFTDHYRRYADFDKIQEKLKNRNFEIIYKTEDNDLAIYNDENPFVIRIIAKKIAEN